MKEFWEDNFIKKQEMWGFKPANSAVIAKDFFVKKGVKNILIPGIGYGRNAQVFRENQMLVTGIEISKTAFEMAKKHYGTDIKIYHGSVMEMPFDNKKYDAIFCHALIHLLDVNERKKLIRDCYNQLSKNGYMVFTTISKEASIYGKGNCISEDRYEIHQGAKIYFYDKESIQREFNDLEILEITEINENQPMYLIKCKKSIPLNS